MNGFSEQQMSMVEQMQARGVDAQVIAHMCVAWSMADSGETVEAPESGVPALPAGQAQEVPVETKTAKSEVTRASALDPASWVLARLMATPDRRTKHTKSPEETLENVAYAMGFGETPGVYGKHRRFETFLVSLAALQKSAALTKDAEFVGILEDLQLRLGKQEFAKVRAKGTRKHALVQAMMRAAHRHEALSTGRAAAKATSSTTSSVPTLPTLPTAQADTPAASSEEQPVDTLRSGWQFTSARDGHARLEADEEAKSFLTGPMAEFLEGYKAPKKGPLHETDENGKVVKDDKGNPVLTAFGSYRMDEDSHVAWRREREVPGHEGKGLCACASRGTTFTCRFAKVEQVANPHGFVGKAIS